MGPPVSVGCNCSMRRLAMSRDHVATLTFTSPGRSRFFPARIFHLIIIVFVCVLVCVCGCVRACVHACGRVCACVCVCLCILRVLPYITIYISGKNLQDLINNPSKERKYLYFSMFLSMASSYWFYGS